MKAKADNNTGIKIAGNNNKAKAAEITSNIIFIGKIIIRRPTLIDQKSNFRNINPRPIRTRRNKISINHRFFLNYEIN
jgi:hypothetical protein